MRCQRCGGGSAYFGKDTSGDETRSMEPPIRKQLSLSRCAASKVAASLRQNAPPLAHFPCSSTSAFSRQRLIRAKRGRRVKGGMPLFAPFSERGPHCCQSVKTGVKRRVCQRQSLIASFSDSKWGVVGKPTGFEEVKRTVRRLPTCWEPFPLPPLKT